MQRLVLGHEPLVPAMPIVLGISATLKRFQDLIQGANREAKQPVNVPVEAVRSSGLLKEVIVLGHPDEERDLHRHDAASTVGGIVEGV